MPLSAHVAARAGGSQSRIGIFPTTPILIDLKHSLPELEAHNFGQASWPVAEFIGTGNHVPVFIRDSNLSTHVRRANAFIHCASCQVLVVF